MENFQVNGMECVELYEQMKFLVFKPYILFEFKMSVLVLQLIQLLYT